MKKVMTCAEAEELLGAYTLDALPEGERARVQEHLLTCSEHRDAVEELRQVTPLLALTVEERDASPELRRRILDAVRREPQAPAAAGPEDRTGAPETPGRIVVPGPAFRRRWQWRPRMVATAAAAALLLLAAGVGLGRLTSPTAPTQQLVTWTFSGNSLAPDARARLVYFKDQQQAVVDVTGLPALSPGQVYELWLFKDGKPIDAGVASTNGGLVARLNRNLGEYSQIAITIEPGEQPQPTSSPILLGTLRSA